MPMPRRSPWPVRRCSTRRRCAPLAAAGIPLRLRNVFAPEASGTDIGPERREHLRRARPRVWVVVARPFRTDLAPPAPFPFEGKIGLALSEQNGHGRARDRRRSGEERELVEVAGVFLDRREPGERQADARYVSTIVPATEAVAAQRRLYAALAHADMHAAHVADLKLPGEWRMTS